MRITAVKTFLLARHRPMLVTMIETDKGLYGLGESGLVTRERGVQGILKDLESLLIGADPFRIEHLWQTMWRSGFHPSGQVLSAAIAAVDIALWDIKGKALGVPIYELLGGRSRDKVLTYCHIRGTTPDDVLAMAREKVSEGWRAIRWEPYCAEDSVFHSSQAVERAIEEFHLLRAELGPDIELIYDAHTKFTPAEAAYLCTQVEDTRPMFIEDALRCEYAKGYAQLRAQTSAPLAAGEQFGTKWDFTTLLADNLVNYARIDLCIAGGLTEARKVAANAETHLIDIAVHNPLGPISTAACLHLNIAIPNMLIQELPRKPEENMADLFTGNHVWKDGYIHCSDAPGLGLEIDLCQLENYPYKHSQLSILNRPDGSFTNW